MKVYLIQNENISSLNAFNNVSVSDLSDACYSGENKNNMKHDSERTIAHRGYPLSSFELSIYYRHYLAWKDLAESEEECALILENVLTINFTGRDLTDIISSFDPHWNIVFPFNGFRKKEDQNSSFIFGFRWGTDAYFIHRSCLPQLLDHKIISLPVDEHLLLLNRQGLLNIQHENDESKIFSFGDDSKYTEDGNKTKLNQILKINLWSSEDRASVRTLLADLCNILDKKKIDFFISDGTLLGYVRHKQIMHWDDDVDISVASLDIENLVEAVNSNEKYKITKWFWGKNKVEYYKIWESNSINVRNLPYGFPFLDIWIYDKNRSHIIYNYGLKVPSNFIFPTKKATFEQTIVSIPNEPIEYLDLKYQDWKEKIVVYRWCHKNERPSLFPLSAKISVDDTGMISTLY